MPFPDAAEVGMGVTPALGGCGPGGSAVCACPDGLSLPEGICPSIRGGFVDVGSGVRVGTGVNVEVGLALGLGLTVAVEVGASVCVRVIVTVGVGLEARPSATEIP